MPNCYYLFVLLLKPSFFTNLYSGRAKEHEVLQKNERGSDFQIWSNWKRC